MMVNPDVDCYTVLNLYITGKY